MEDTVARLEVAVTKASTLGMRHMEAMAHFHMMTLQPAAKTHAHNAKQLFGQKAVGSRYYAGALLPAGLYGVPLLIRCVEKCAVLTSVCLLCAELCGCSCKECKELGGLSF